MFIGHPVALLIWTDFDRYRRAKNILKFNEKVVRYGAKAELYQADPYGSFRFVRVGGETPFEPDVFSSLKDSMLFPIIRQRKPVWSQQAKINGDLTQQGLYYAERMEQQLKAPPEDWLVFDERFTTQSIEPAALEADNGNGWYDAESGTLHFVVATQCPFEVAEQTAHMLAPSRFKVAKLNLHPGYTVGYGSKDNNIFVFYAALAAMYGEGVPVRLANDRYEQFQSGIKRHPFDMHYQLAVNKQDHSFQIFRAHMDVDGGGRANYSSSVAAVGATAAQSIYYLPQSDLAATAYHSRGVEAGSMRGYGTLQTMAATEMMVDEVAGRLGLDAIDLRKKNVFKTGMKNTQGAIPAGALRLDEILDKAAQHEIWRTRAERKKRFDAEDPDNLYGVGFAMCQKDFGTGSEAPLASLEITADGRVLLRHVAIDMGTGMATSQALLAADHLGQPAHEIKTGETDWHELGLVTSGNPIISQADQDAALKNPRWVGKLASPSSATNSAYYSGHATREAARILFNHGLWPAALSIWGRGEYNGSLNPYVVRREDAHWKDGALSAGGMPPIPFELLARKAHDLGLITGASVHGFNRWKWASAEFEINGVRESLPLDAVAVKYGTGADAGKRALMTRNGYHLLDRVSVSYPETQLNNAMVTYYSPVATLVEIKVNKGSGEARVINHHSWMECGRVIVPELVLGQLEGGIAMGIGHALMEEMPLYEGPGRGHLELQPLPAAPREGCRRVVADGGDPAAAVAQRPGQGHRRSGDDPRGRRHRERRGPCHRQAPARPSLTPARIKEALHG